MLVHVRGPVVKTTNNGTPYASDVQESRIIEHVHVAGGVLGLRKLGVEDRNKVARISRKKAQPIAGQAADGPAKIHVVPCL